MSGEITWARGPRNAFRDARTASISLFNPYALTLKNPWADLVARGGKDVENRSWMPYESVDTLLIHAGKGWDDDAPSFSVVVTSAIVAVADLAFACNTSRWTDTIKCGCGKWAQPGQCHWNLINIRALPEPVPATGRQGLWRPTLAMISAIERQLTEAGRKVLEEADRG